MGYYQQKPTHQFLFEKIGYDAGHIIYFRNDQESAASTFSSSWRNNWIHALLNVVTGKTIAIIV